MLPESRESGHYEELITRVIEVLQEQGFEDIKADIDAYPTPHRFTGKTNDVNFTPDITATKNNSKAYFEISSRSDDVNALVNKWKVLDTLALMKDGIFKIFVPHGHMKFTQQVIEAHGIHADLIKL